MPSVDKSYVPRWQNFHMELPDVISDLILDDETILSRTLISNGVELIVTSTRLFLYRGVGLINTESFEEYKLNVDRISISLDRKKAQIILDYGINRPSVEFQAHRKYLDMIYDPLIRGAIHANNTLQQRESIKKICRKGELTIVLTNMKILKHIGTSLWDIDFESFDLETISKIYVDAGGISSELIIESNNRLHRIKTTANIAQSLCDSSINELISFHNFPTYSEFQKSSLSSSDDMGISVSKPSKNDTKLPPNHSKKLQKQSVQLGEILDKLNSLKSTVKHNNKDVESKIENINKLIKKL